jgi:hypothetical protein
MVGWQNDRAWFQKNDYHKIKIICINKKFTCFFKSIDSVSKSLIIFQKKKKKSQWAVWHVKEMKIVRFTTRWFQLAGIYDPLLVFV